MQKFIHSSKNGGFAYCYLAPQVEARVAELEKRPDLCEMEPPDVSHDLSNGVVCIGCWSELAHRAGKQAVALESMSDRIAELEREKHDLQSALRELLQDTQHVNHNCGDTSDRCPVLRAREVLNELMVSATK